MNDSEDLLRPTLSAIDDIADHSRPYSPHAFVVASFIGGPIAAAILFGWNFHKLGQPTKIRWTVIYFGVLALVQMIYPFLLIEEWTVDGLKAIKDQSAQLRWSARIVTLASALACSRIQTKRFEIIVSHGIEPMGALKPSLLAILVSIVISMGFAIAVSAALIALG